jgi:hypothetical protein
MSRSRKEMLWKKSNAFKGTDALREWDVGRPTWRD